jgi:CHAT domain-containing protein/tetratricopeptide (TPR) repeat protein
MRTTETPVHRLANQILAGELTAAEAIEKTAPQSVLADLDDVIIDQLDDMSRERREKDLARATELAIFNCYLARRRSSALCQGNCETTLGWLYFQQDELDLALRHYQKALSSFRAVPDVQGTIARIRFDLGEIRQRQHKYKAAIDEYKAAWALVENLGPAHLASDVQNGLGRAYLSLEQADAALAAFQQALGTSQAHDDPRGEETALGNMGLVYRFLGRWAEAAEYHRQALAISRRIGHQAGTGRHLSGLANMLIELKDKDKAESCLREAIDLARQLHDPASEQQRLGNMGNLYQARAEQEPGKRREKRWLTKAKRYHQEALAIARRIGDLRSQTNHHANLGNVCSQLGRFEEAETHYRGALDLAEAHEIIDVQWRVHYAWGNLQATQYQDRMALGHYETAMGIVEGQRTQLIIESRTKFWQERTALYKQLVLCCLRLGELWQALDCTERAKARYLADLLDEQAGLVDDNDISAITTAVLNALPPRTAVVVFNVTEVGTAVFIVANEANAGHIPDDTWVQSPDGRIRVKLIEDLTQQALQRILVKVGSSGEAVGGYMVDYYANRDKWSQSTLESASTRIYDALLAPLHERLARLSIERVVLVPNLGLSLLPLHACGAKGRCLLDDYEIAYVPSLNVLRRCQEQARSKPPSDRSLFAVANPTGDLVWAGTEVERVREFFSRTRILRDGGDGQNDLATVQAVEAEAGHYAFVHFASHGRFDLRDPLQSALKLAKPESLTLKTIFERMTLPRTRLVVISACETGLVDPGDLADEYIGLPSGFFHARVPTVISSLWLVDDLSTALLMERLYQAHLQEGMHVGRALQAAQYWLRKDVDRPFVVQRIELLLDDLAMDRERASPFSEEQWAIDRHMERLKKQRRRLLDEEKRDPGGRPFEHLYYWAPFTVTGVGFDADSRQQERI